MVYSSQDFRDFTYNELSQDTSSPFSGLATFGIGAGLVGLSLKRDKQGNRYLSRALRGLAHLEGGLPMGVGATFRGTELLSPLVSPSSFTLSATAHKQLFGKSGFQEYIAFVTGKPLSYLRSQEAFTKGFTWNRTGGTLGELSIIGGPTLASNVGLMSTGGRRQGHILEWFARTLGVKDPTFIRRVDETMEARPTSMFIGAGGSKAKLAGKYAYGTFSWLLGRMNLLLESPFDLEVMKEWSEKIPGLNRLRLGVKPGTGLQMLRRFATKAGIAYGGYKALSYLDYQGREGGRVQAATINALTGAALGAGAFWKSGKGGRAGLIGGLVGGALGALTGEGPLSSFASIYARLNIGRASVSHVTGLGQGAQRAEGSFEGITKPTTLVGFMGVGLLGGGTYNYFKRLNLARRIAGERQPLRTISNVHGIYEKADELIKAKQEGLYKYYDDVAKDASGLNKIVAELKRSMSGKMSGKSFRPGGVGKHVAAGAAAYVGLSTIGSLLSGDILGAGLQAAAGVGAAVAYAKKGGAAALGVLALPFLLREQDTPDRLEKIYSGEELVQIKHGRFWEAGRTDYQGRKGYFRPHRVAMIRSGSRAKALAGSEEAYWESDPMLNPVGFLMDPYKRERLMWQQGYKFPVSATPFEDFPVVGPVLAATVGRLIKPPVKMGVNEWMPERGVGAAPDGYMNLPAEEPIERTSLKATIGEQFYRLSEMFGMPGFAMQAITERLTGASLPFSQDQYATSSLVAGIEPSWWSLELGGLGLLCIAEGSIVQTRRGNIPIEEVVIGDEVLSRDSKFYKVKQTSSRVDEEIRNISVQCLGATLRCTPNHVIPVYEFYPCHDRNSRSCVPGRCKHCDYCRKSSKEIISIDKPAGEINVGDWLEVPLPQESLDAQEIDILEAGIDDTYTNGYIYAGCSLSFAQALELIELNNSLTREDLRNFGIPDQFAKEAIRSFRQGCNPRRYQREIKLTSELAYVLGWYAAEGCINKKYTTQFIMHISEEKYAKKIGRIVARELNATWNIYKYPEKNTLVLYVSSPILNRLVRILVGVGSHNKEIDSRIMHASKEVKAAFLRGYMLGDGFCNPNKGAAGISTVSRNLAIQSYLIGASLGFRGGVVLDYKEKPNGKYPQGDKRKETIRSYVEWAKETAIRLREFLIGQVDEFPSHGNIKGSFLYKNKLYVRVSKVEDKVCPNTKVYDLWVDGLNYFTSEFIAVHNSEGIRRYIPHNRTDVQFRNPLPSGLPSWLPDSDSDYFLDFSRADIYTKIKEPWARLPGEGLGALHPELKGVSPEKYSPFWRFMVLSDVAPYSQEHRQYDRMMKKMEADKRLTPKQIMEVEKARRRSQEMKKAKDFNPYIYDDEAVERKRVTILGETSPGLFITDTFGSAPISLAGIQTGQATLANIAEQQNASLTASQAMETGMRKRAQISDYLRGHLYPGAEVDVYVHKSPDLQMERSPSGQPVVQAIVASNGVNLNKQLVEMGLAAKMDNNSVLNATREVGAVRAGFGAFWENLMHGAETPLETFTPLAPVSKFIHQRSALEDYQRSEVYSRDVALWQHPISHFISPGFKTTLWWAGFKDVPTDVKQQYMVNEYFDRLKYIKWKNIEQQAFAKGEGELAAEASGKSKLTITGADKFSDKSIAMALPANERPYFRAFVEAPTRRERQEISDIVSPQLREVLHAQWARRAAEAAEMRLESGVGQRSDLQTAWRIRRQMREQARQPDVEDVAQDMPVPGPGWVGYSPAARIDDYKTKTILDKNMDPTRFGIWDDDIRRVERKPYVHPISHSFEESDRQMSSYFGLRRRYHRLMNSFGHRGPSMDMRADGNMYIDVNSPRYDRIDQYMNDPSILTF